MRNTPPQPPNQECTEEPFPLRAPLTSLTTSLSSPSSYPCISVTSRREKEVDESGKIEGRNAGGKDGGGVGGLTSSEQRIPAAKQAMKPFILVPELNEAASTT